MRYYPSEDKITKSIQVLKPDKSGENIYQNNIKRSQKIIEFKELRSGKDQAYILHRQIKFHQWGKRGAEHMVAKQLIGHSFVTVYDYDIKLYFLAVCVALVLLLK